MKKNVRELALEVLMKIEKNDAYSHILLNETIHKAPLNDRDIALLTEIVYGTIQRRDTLDFYLQPFTKNAKKIQLWVQMLLRLSVYQLVYLSKIPPHAVVHEAVEIAKKRGHKGASGFVNGVLRNFLRTPLRSFAEISDPIERIAVETSHPLWLVKRWVDVYGMDETEKMCKENVLTPKVSIRMNLWKASPEEIIEKLEKEGVFVTRGHLSEDSLLVEKGNVIRTRCFEEGYVTVQDESSMLVARALDPKPNATILDCCAAPGGKTTHIAERMNNEGKIIACDIHEHKLRLIEEAGHRLGISIIQTMALDARKADEAFAKESFDYILVDAPCTGFGVIRRKPDVKWRKTEKEIETMAAIQIQILRSAAKLLKQGGRLVYSTCTVERDENENIVEQFLKEHPHFEPDETLAGRLPKKIAAKGRLKNGQVTILPHDFHTDGFFIAAMVSKGTP